MEYEYRKDVQPSPQLSGYDMPTPMYQLRTERSGLSHSNSSSFYPRIAQSGGASVNRLPPPTTASTPFSGTGIKVAIKPTYQVASPPRLLAQGGELPRSFFQFDFDLEHRILAEAEIYIRAYEKAPRDHSSPANGDASLAESDDAVVSKYVAMGLNKQAVIKALQTFGDLQNKVLDFCPSYTAIREMGFQPDDVAGALAMFDNDRERAIAYLV